MQGTTSDLQYTSPETMCVLLSRVSSDSVRLAASRKGTMSISKETDNVVNLTVQRKYQTRKSTLLELCKQITMRFTGLLDFVIPNAK